ncbi:sugar ABC transporter ATP-binding protein [bacterium]|nr:sugar ABC transporter ATP-binding protein [bacterium]
MRETNRGKNNTLPAAVSLRRIHKSFSGVEVLHGIDLDIHYGRVTALMGENGAGKSTLMNVLSGVHTDWTGSLLINGEGCRFGSPADAEAAGIAMIHQELNLVPGLSVAGNLFLGREPAGRFGRIDFTAMHRKARDIMDQLRFEPPVTAAVESLPVGQRQLVEIGKALASEAQVILMDEPTSAHSEREIDTLFTVVRQLRARGVAVVYVSHRLEEIYRIADTIAVLRDGRLVHIAETGSLTRADLVQQMIGRPEERFYEHEDARGDEIVLRVSGLSCRHPDVESRTLIRDISFDVRRGEILGIAGLLGSGRTVLLESLFGAAPGFLSGRVELEGELLEIGEPSFLMSKGMALLTEDRQRTGLIPGLSVRENYILAALLMTPSWAPLTTGDEEDRLAAAAEDLSISMADPGQPIVTLSGGNQQKVLLAKWLAIGPRLLLLDEPTRGIDVGARHDIYLLLSRLRRQGVSIIMTSSELDELIAVCDRILVLRDGRTAGVYVRTECTRDGILKAASG